MVVSSSLSDSTFQTNLAGPKIIAFSPKGFLLYYRVIEKSRFCKEKCGFSARLLQNDGFFGKFSSKSGLCRYTIRDR
jgi:hypothetical protein